MLATGDYLVLLRPFCGLACDWRVGAKFRTFCARSSSAVWESSTESVRAVPLTRARVSRLQCGGRWRSGRTASHCDGVPRREFSFVQRRPTPVLQPRMQSETSSLQCGCECECFLYGLKGRVWPHHRVAGAWTGLRLRTRQDCRLASQARNACADGDKQKR
jgi:hypothetical protein